MTFRSIALLLGAAMLASCTKNGVQDITSASPGAAVMFFNFGVNSPGVNFYANDTKMTAISSTDSVESNNGTTYGSAGAGANYAGITPGTYTLSGRIADSVDKNLAISSVSTSLEDGKRYSFYQSGIYDTTAKTVDAFVVEDPLPAVDYTVAYVRFVNAIANADPMTLYATGDSSGVETAVGSEVAYKAAGDYTAVPQGFYNLATRTSGSSTDAITRTGVSFSAGHIYTVTARGDITATSGSAVPKLDNTANR
jgi:hypothetical protein